MKLSKLTCALTACLLILSQITRADDESEIKNSEDLFADKEHLGIYLNKFVDNMKEKIDNSDKLTLLYLFRTD